MLKRLFLALLLTAVSVTVASAQPAADLMFHRTAAGGTEMIQRAVLLPVPPPPGPPGPELANVPQAALPLTNAVVGYLAGHGYLSGGSYGIDVQQTGGGWVIHVSGPGPGVDIVIHAPGPFLPGPEPIDLAPHALISVLVVRYDISNGF
jgi:hypothetical protein